MAPQLLNTKREFINPARDSRFHNPFGDDTARFRVWLETQPWLITKYHRLLNHFAVIYPRQYNRADAKIWDEIRNGQWESKSIPEPVFVFGSNTKGYHGRGAARDALNLYGAQYGVGAGPTGHAYAIPTKDGSLNSLPMATVLAGINEFFQYAHDHPKQWFQLTRVGCGLAGLDENEIRQHAAAHAPGNVILPGTWEATRQPGLIRIIVAGSRDFTGTGIAEEKLNHLLQNLDDFVFISGGARGADTLGERYAVQHNRHFERFPALWEFYDKAAGGIRNQLMSWYATHLVAFWDGKSPGTRSMIKLARADGLNVRVVRTDRIPR